MKSRKRAERVPECISTSLHMVDWWWWRCGSGAGGFSRSGALLSIWRQMFHLEDTRTTFCSGFPRERT